MLKLIKLEPEPSPFKLRKQMKIDVPVLGLAGSHGREMKIGPGTQIGVPICITRSNGCLRW